MIANTVPSIWFLQVNATARRLSQLSLIESALYHETRLLSDDCKLTFSCAPSSLEDDPAPLHPTNKDSVDFTRLRSWLMNRLSILHSLKPLGHRDLDRRCWTLIQRMNDQLEGMSRWEASTWEREKVLTGLYGFPDEADSPGERCFETGGY